MPVSELLIAIDSVAEVTIRPVRSCESAVVGEGNAGSQAVLRGVAALEQRGSQLHGSEASVSEPAAGLDDCAGDVGHQTPDWGGESFRKSVSRTPCADARGVTDFGP